ncbi:unnamed protein product [Merluccius merluccius]
MGLTPRVFSSSSPQDSCGYLLRDCGMADEGESPTAGTWDHFGVDQAAMIRIEDAHLGWCQEARGDDDGGGGGDRDRPEAEAYVLPPPMEMEGAHFLDGEMTVGDSLREFEEEHGVYLIEYSPDPEETKGDGYDFQLQGPPKKEEPKSKPPTGREHLRRPLAKKTGKYSVPSRRPDGGKARGETLQNSQSLWGGESLGGETGPRAKAVVVCSLCPPPGKAFKNMAGFSVHLKQLHYNGMRKSFFCDMCQKHCRNQLVLDDHVRRHASKAAVFQCPLCPFKAPGKIRKRGVKGRFGNGIRVHLETEHPGVVPGCGVCKKNFRSLNSYLKDQVRHIGVTPFYCPRCQIYEMTERGLLVHMRNHSRKKDHGEEEEEEEEEGRVQGEHDSGTDDSDCY